MFIIQNSVPMAEWILETLNMVNKKFKKKHGQW